MSGQDREPRDVQLHHERGSASVLVLCLVMVALLLTTSLVGLARVASARGSAQAAADLAALAAARVSVRTGSSTDVCAVAALVTSRHGARLDTCDHRGGGMVEVSASVLVTAAPGWHARATAEARAGPVGRQ